MKVGFKKPWLTDRPRKGVWVMQLQAGDLVSIEGEPHRVLQTLNGGRMLVKPLNRRMEAVAENDFDC